MRNTETPQCTALARQLFSAQPTSALTHPKDTNSGLEVEIPMVSRISAATELK